MMIAIDGPAGSGKSSVAKAVAQRLGFRYLDTGAMYRAVALRALLEGVSLTDEDGVCRIAESEKLAFAHEPGEALPTRVLIGGQDVTEAIRTPRVDDAVSPVARLPRVREALVAQQRQLAEGGDIVVEGRDIGSVVFPHAEVKVFLTADPKVRARRRTAQQSAVGLSVDDAAVHDAILRRDLIDSTRSHSPLTAPEDALQIDTSELTLDEVVDRITDAVKGR